MKEIRFLLGDRVRVLAGYEWAKGACGVIAEPPESVRSLVEDDASWEMWHRFVQGKNGIIEFYYVHFDDPQYDMDGDGPYTEAEIEADMLGAEAGDGS